MEIMEYEPNEVGEMNEGARWPCKKHGADSFIKDTFLTPNRGSLNDNVKCKRLDSNNEIVIPCLLTSEAGLEHHLQARGFSSISPFLKQSKLVPKCRMTSLPVIRTARVNTHSMPDYRFSNLGKKKKKRRKSSIWKHLPARRWSHYRLRPPNRCARAAQAGALGTEIPAVQPWALRCPLPPRPRPRLAPGVRGCWPPRLTRRVQGGNGSAVFTPAQEAPAAPWSPTPLPLPLARSLSVRSVPLTKFRVLRSTRNQGDPQQVFPTQVGGNLRWRDDGPYPKRTPPRLAGSAESPTPDRNGAPGAREEGGVLARDREPSVAGTGLEGRGDTRVAGRIGAREMLPRPQLKRGVKTKRVWGGTGMGARRLPAGCPAPTRGVSHVSRARSREAGASRDECVRGCLSDWGCTGVCLSFLGSEGRRGSTPAARFG
nr:uncharacterized protein LOC111750614 [Loxodonta africana]